MSVLSLLEFLDRREPDSPLRPVRWASDGIAALDLWLEVDSPWWGSTADRQSSTGELRLAMRQIHDSELHVEWREFDPDELSATQNHPLLWSRGPRGTLFGNGPISNPLTFLTEMADWLREHDAAGDIRDYCGGHSFAALANHLSHPSYALMDGPLPILTKAQRLLDERRVPTQLLKTPFRGIDNGILVRFGASWLICESATVEIAPG